MTDRSAHLDRLAAQVEAEGGRLVELPGSDRDYDLGRVTRSLLMWSIALGRMAESGSAVYRSIPAFGEPHPDPLASHRALLDVVTFLTVGDMVLNDFAALQLGRWGPSPGGSWPSFMQRLDRGEPELEELRLTARYLDLVLRAARDRVVAHRSRRHAMATAWGIDGTFEVSMIGLDGSAKAEAELLRILAEVGRQPGWSTDYHVLVESVMESAPLFDRKQRERATRAFGRGGYHVYLPSAIVGALLRMTSTIGWARPVPKKPDS